MHTQTTPAPTAAKRSRPHHSYGRIVAGAASAAVLALLLTACSTPTTSGGSDATAESTQSDTTDQGALECTDTTVDDAVCDDLNEAIDDSADQPCSLADGSAVWTPAMAEFNPDSPARCGVPDEAAFFAALAANGAQIDGVADMGTEGTADYNIFYIVRGGCGGEPTYWPATNSWSRFKGSSPSLTDERFATPADVVTAICTD